MMLGFSGTTNTPEPTQESGKEWLPSALEDYVIACVTYAIRNGDWRGITLDRLVEIGREGMAWASEKH